MMGTSRTPAARAGRFSAQNRPSVTLNTRFVAAFPDAGRACIWEKF
jgi:hypothetical protein